MSAARKVAGRLSDATEKFLHAARVPMEASNAASGLASVTSAIDAVRDAADPHDVVSGIGIALPAP